MAPRTRTFNPEQLGLMVKAARMYHEQNLSQADIAEKLNVSQSRVSRWLTDAVREGIVRTIVVAPPGTESDLEDAVAAKYGLSAVVIADLQTDDEAAIIRGIGATAAGYLEVTLTGGNRVGCRPGPRHCWQRWTRCPHETSKPRKASSRSSAESAIPKFRCGPRTLPTGWQQSPKEPPATCPRPALFPAAAAGTPCSRTPLSLRSPPTGTGWIRFWSASEASNRHRSCGSQAIHSTNPTSTPSPRQVR
ncbi:helix-turn-helix domain-containing protein [Arthrobacter sp. ISL-65]|nr:helix-turn-helix domain-containing protein [Arthrobacter sp. ISL-65]